MPDPLEAFDLEALRSGIPREPIELPTIEALAAHLHQSGLVEALAGHLHYVVAAGLGSSALLMCAGVVVAMAAAVVALRPGGGSKSQAKDRAPRKAQRKKKAK